MLNFYLTNDKSLILYLARKHLSLDVPLNLTFVLYPFQVSLWFLHYKSLNMMRVPDIWLLHWVLLFQIDDQRPWQSKQFMHFNYLGRYHFTCHTHSLSIILWCMETSNFLQSKSIKKCILVPPSSLTATRNQYLSPPLWRQIPAHVNRLTDTCKNITFPQLRLLAVKSWPAGY